MIIILATGNQHKIREFSAMLGDKDIKVYAYEEILKPLHIIENGTSFAENASIKVQAIYEALYTQSQHQDNPHTQNPPLLQAPLALIAEDSGLCVSALNGEPGIYSARYAEYKHFVKNLAQNTQKMQNPHPTQAHTMTHNSTDSDNLQCLIEQIAPFAPTPAFFVAHIALIYVKSLPLLPFSQCHIEHFEGKLEGVAISEPRGNEGFGYDPIFMPNEHNPLRKSLAEFEPSAKNAISHRRQALSQCVEWLDKKRK